MVRVSKIPARSFSDDNGFFAFEQLDPGTYHITITAEEFADWSSPDLILSPGQYLILPASKLLIAKAVTAVNVSDSSVEVATEQVTVEETQRVFGIIPNFYVVYEPNPAPLTTKLKFQLALKTSSDAATILGVAVLAGINQAGDTPDYVQGAKGYAQRYGAAAADGLSDIMIGGAILPSLLHQDPRYYFQGTGSSKSRTFHALSSPFVCKGDNGKMAAQLFEHRWRSGLGSSLQHLLPGVEPRRGSGLPEFPHYHGRAHAQQHAAGIRIAQANTQSRKINTRLRQKLALCF